MGRGNPAPAADLNATRFDATMRIMALKDPTFTIGIEEEYLLVDRASRDLVREMPHGPVRGGAAGACRARWRASS